MTPLAQSRLLKAPPRVFLTFLLAAPLPIPVAAARQAESPAAALGKIRSKAETQHEIVVLLIRKKEFDQANLEAAKIFDMSWPANEEPTLLKELQLLSKTFEEVGQPSMAMKLLDSNSRAFKSVKSQVWIWKEKGYLYKSMNQNDKALECFRTAQRLEDAK
jgi:tetratricopeptide (TPR) repeat protein